MLLVVTIPRGLSSAGQGSRLMLLGVALPRGLSSAGQGCRLMLLGVAIPRGLPPPSHEGESRGGRPAETSNPAHG